MAEGRKPGKPLDLFKQRVGLIKREAAKDGSARPEIDPPAFEGKEIRQHRARRGLVLLGAGVWTSQGLHNMVAVRAERQSRGGFQRMGVACVSGGVRALRCSINQSPCTIACRWWSM